MLVQFHCSVSADGSAGVSVAGSAAVGAGVS